MSLSTAFYSSHASLFMICLPRRARRGLGSVRHAAAAHDRPRSAACGAWSGTVTRRALPRIVVLIGLFVDALLAAEELIVLALDGARGRLVGLLIHADLGQGGQVLLLGVEVGVSQRPGAREDLAF